MTLFHLCKTQLTETEIQPMQNMSDSHNLNTDSIGESVREIINEGELAISDR